jgi:hypothetical protein
MPATRRATAADAETARRRARRTRIARLLAELHPLVPGALEELLVLLLAHLLPALLD